mmetsp:Transcript_40260/g.74481  ORF Transcript_40260/g.74481 Transcript_40260/m.74481 type:complete len:172 (-) Transcript_40260:426-941(-)
MRRSLNKSIQKVFPALSSSRNERFTSEGSNSQHTKHRPTASDPHPLRELNLRMSDGVFSLIEDMSTDAHLINNDDDATYATQVSHTFSHASRDDLDRTLAGKDSCSFSECLDDFLCKRDKGFSLHRIEPPILKASLSFGDRILERALSVMEIDVQAEILHTGFRYHYGYQS